MKTLVAKLNPSCRKALELAAALCVSQTNFNVEIEHLLRRLLDQPDTDLACLLRYYEIDSGRLVRDLDNAIASFPRGNGRTPALSTHLPVLLEEAWKLSTLELGGTAIRSGALVLALLQQEMLRGLILDSAPELFKIPGHAVEDVREIIARSREENAERASAPPSPAPARAPTAAGSALEQYTIDLTAEARAGKIDPIRGRDVEIRQIIDILLRRRQNNPILTGEAGVGKTAVVEGFALKVAMGHVPPPLQGVAVRTLDLGLLQAGAGVRGEFENRLKGVIAEVKASPIPIILFIDEAHTLIGAGSQPGQSDAANLLKPALARGELRTIAATTWSEYKKYFEKDPALARRFQVIRVAEPDEANAIAMLRAVAANLERHHGVRILEEAVRDAVRLSSRYLSGRQLPDKAISVLDTACARVSIAQRGAPAPLEAMDWELGRLRAEIAALKREAAAGIDHRLPLQELTVRLEQANAEWHRLDARWREEAALVARCTELRERLETQAPLLDEDETNWLCAELQDLEQELAELQGEEPLVPVCVNSQVVAAVVAAWTGIPVGRMLTDEIRTVLSLREELGRRVIGQDPALEVISRRIRTYRANLGAPGKPVGVFLLVGPSGVGKTETALALAELLYGGERTLVTINMSEYQEAHTISGLKGAPPGYVGYGAGGVLTEAVRRNPYSVVLLDEAEKAHPDVIELFYQVFDKGMLEDGEGQVVDFKNTLILLTSNLGAELIMQACEQDRRPPVEELVKRLRPVLVQRFKPALLGRMVVAPFYPLGDEEIRRIVRLQLTKLQQLFREQHRAALSYEEAVIDAIAHRCTEVDSGARNIDHILTHTLLPELAAEVLERMARQETFSEVHVALGPGGGFVYAFTESAC